jgi:hypothetical protein
MVMEVSASLSIFLFGLSHDLCSHLIGKYVALHLESRFIRVFAEIINADVSGNFENVIRETYKQTDKEVLEVSTNKGWVCGSTGKSRIKFERVSC